MSYTPSVGYAGPDGATRSLTNELTSRDGPPARPYEFVTGWKSPTNVSGHNPDSNGITHGVDIFTGNLRRTADHLAARGKAGDRRVLYVIYAGQIASAATGWVFSGSGWEHWDHVHLSVWDGYWGSPCTLPASIYNDTSSWGIATTGALSTDKTPITSEEDDMFADKDRANLETTLGRVTTLVAMLDNVANAVTATPGRVLDKQVPRAGSKSTTSLGLFLSYADADREATVARLQSAISSIPAADLAAQIDAAGVAADVRDELVKLLAGGAK